MSLNRALLQQLSTVRAGEAEALLQAGQWSGAYYLVGYAVECGLKACIAKLTNQHDFPNKERAQNSFTHDLEKLIQVAELKSQRDLDMAANTNLGTNWLLVKDWSEKSRYQEWSEQQARKLVAAVTDSTNGVLPWIKGLW